MKESRESDWQPLSEAVLNDPVAAYDDMRRRCPVAYSETFGWSVFRHADLARVLADHETFSNVVSSRRSVPNGMDPPEHTVYRRALEPQLAPEQVQLFEPVCRGLAAELLQALAGGVLDAMDDFAAPFSVRSQCAFLGWPAALAEPLRAWARRNHEATLAADRAALAALASEFRAYVEEQLAARRAAGASGSDVMARLMRVRVNGALLTDDELTSVLRNWTVGEIGSLAAGIGIVVHELAQNSDLQRRLRAEPGSIPLAIEEILRVTGPLLMNRRVARRDVELGGRRIAAGERLTLMWVAANRDPEVFEAPERVQLDRDQSQNLLYGAGIHVCPGAPLARLELRVAIEELLRRAPFELGGEPVPAIYPAHGWRSLPVRFA